MHPKLASILATCNGTKGDDGIYSVQMSISSPDQQIERETRERVTAHQDDNYLATIARHHSIPVMDDEIDRFLTFIPYGAMILDIGGGWGWHWRRLSMTRPDISVLIIDFVRSNLSHAKKVLCQLVGTQVALMHADATSLPFPDGNVGGFDGVWTVQTFQHIPDFACACREAHRVLKPGGYFVNYSLHVTPFNRIIYGIFGKKFHTEGMKKNAFYLNRANNIQRQIVSGIFGGKVSDRYTECLFHPDLKLTFSGRIDSSIGRLDSYLGYLPRLGRWIARQRSFEVRKLPTLIA